MRADTVDVGACAERVELINSSAPGGGSEFGRAERFCRWRCVYGREICVDRGRRATILGRPWLQAVRPAPTGIG